MSDIKEAGPLEILRDNAKLQREAATGYRRDAERMLKRASEADSRAEQWDAAFAILDAATKDSAH